MLKSLIKKIEVLETKHKTGFDQSLEGEQTWPPKKFKVTIKETELDSDSKQSQISDYQTFCKNTILTKDIPYTA